MFERWVMAYGERVVDTGRVLVPNGAVLLFINLVNLKILGELGLIGLTIVYTIWRWRRDSFVLCEGCREGRPPGQCPLPRNKRPFWCPRNI